MRTEVVQYVDLKTKLRKLEDQLRDYYPLRIDDEDAASLMRHVGCESIAEYRTKSRELRQERRELREEVDEASSAIIRLGEAGGWTPEEMGAIMRADGHSEQRVQQAVAKARKRQEAR